MKVVLMGSFPIYDYAEELGVDPRKLQRVTSWNENLAKGIAENSEIDVHFITSTDLIPKTRLIRRGRLSLTFFVSPRMTNVITGFQYKIFAVRRMLRRINPDIVHGIGTEHIWPYIASGSSFPWVVTVHGVMSEIVKKVPTPLISRARIFSGIERYVLRRAKHLISINPYVLSVLGKYTRARTYSIENAISTHFFQCQAKPGDSFNILFVGDIQPRKDLISLVEAFSILGEKEANFDKITLSVVGAVSDHDYFLKLRDMIKHRGLEDKIVFRGFMLPHELILEYEKAALLVLSSIEETAPMCIAEAMCVGLPVVSTTAGGVEHMICDGETGYLVSVQQPHALAEVVARLMRSPDLRNEMGEKGRKVARKKFHPQTISKQTISVYESVVRGAQL